MKIVYLSPVGMIGGAEMCLLDVLETVGKAHPDWKLGAILGDDGPLRGAIEGLGMTCEVIPFPAALARVGDAGMSHRGAGQGAGLVAAALAALAYRKRLGDRLRDEAPDLVQTNGMKAHVLGAWAAPRGVPVVWHMHDYPGSRPVMGRLLRGSARGTVAAVAVSRSVADDAVRVLGGRVPIRTIHNAVDLDRFTPGPGDGARLDAASGLPEAAPGTVRVGLVATFARWKGHEVFLDAARLVPRGLPCRFYVVGGPIYRSVGSQYSLDELRGLAGSLGVGDRVGFAGHWPDPAGAIRALDVVVHASTRPEPFGRVIAEAMACGRAAVAVGQGGAAEVFEDGATALGCPPGDSAALAAAIARLVADPGLRQRLGASGREVARARFDRSRLAGQWGEVYASIGR